MNDNDVVVGSVSLRDGEEYSFDTGHDSERELRTQKAIHEALELEFNKLQEQVGYNKAERFSSYFAGAAFIINSNDGVCTCNDDGSGVRSYGKKYIPLALLLSYRQRMRQVAHNAQRKETPVDAQTVREGKEDEEVS